MINSNNTLPLPPYAESLAGQAPLVRSARLFKGEEGNPLLAPRGVWMVGDRLMVSDTGQNRVFIWSQLPDTEYATASVVLGQTEHLDTGRNAGQAVSGSTLQYPSGLWSDGQRLIVADAWNHRVLVWHTFPTRSGQPADVVIGQPDASSNLPNVAGIGAPPSARSLNWPYGVFSDGQRFWIADTGNRRVLFFEQIPRESFAPADGVVGKPSFDDRDYDPQDPIWPYAVRLGPKGQLLVADTQYYRQLLWRDWRSALTQRADVVIGQPDFEANGMNRFSLSPRPDSLSWNYDACFDGEGLWVADTGNSRLLWFDQVPGSHGAVADNLIGHPRFDLGSENAETRLGTDQHLYWPFSICCQGNRLALADTGNHRVVLFEK